MQWGISKCREIVEDAKKLSVDILIPLKTAEAIKQERLAKIKYVSTGCESFDKMLGGKGLETDSIYGLAGKLGSGKTQLCLTASVITVKDGGMVAYIETEPSTFRPERIEEIANSRGIEVNLDADILVVPSIYIDSPDKLLLAYERVEKAIVKEGKNIRLICIDSFSAPFRSFYTGREQLGDRSKMIFKHISTLQRMASKYNVCVLLTDHVMSVPVATPALQHMLEASYGDTKIPALGDSLLHSVTVWIALQKTGRVNWRATVFDAPHLPRETIEFTVAQKGIQDK